MTKTVLITGTSSGLGRATARLFHMKGWNVIATMRTPELETEFNSLDRMLVARLDVQDIASIQQAVDAGITRFGHIDVLINNAGYGTYGPLEATSIEAIRRQFEVNALGPLATIKAVLPHFRERRAGSVVNISSMGGRVAFPLGTPYHGTKFALEGMSEALQYELGEIGVRVKLVEPGMIKTDFGGRSFDFNNNADLVEYQPFVQSVMSAFGPIMAVGAEPEHTAEVVHKAAIDQTDQLRFEAGEDAVQLLGHRSNVDDKTFFAEIKTNFTR